MWRNVYLSLITGSLSAIGVVVLVACVGWRDHFQNPLLRLLTYTSLTEFFPAIASLVSVFENGSPSLCNLDALLRQLFAPASFYLSVFFSVFLVRSLVFGHPPPSSAFLDLLGVGTSYTLATAATVAVFVTNTIGEAGDWCWIAGPWWVQFVAFYAPLLLAMAVSIACFVLVARTMVRLARRRDLSSAQKREIGGVYRRFVVFPLVFCFIHAWPFASRAHEWLMGASCDWMRAMAALFGASDGFFNMLIYTEAPFVIWECASRLVRRMLPARCFGRRHSPASTISGCRCSPTPRQVLHHRPYCFARRRSISLVEVISRSDLQPAALEFAGADGTGGCGDSPSRRPSDADPAATAVPALLGAGGMLTGGGAVGLGATAGRDSPGGARLAATAGAGSTNVGVVLQPDDSALSAAGADRALAEPARSGSPGAGAGALPVVSTPSSVIGAAPPPDALVQQIMGTLPFPSETAARLIACRAAQMPAQVDTGSCDYGVAPPPPTSAEGTVTTTATATSPTRSRRHRTTSTSARDGSRRSPRGPTTPNVAAGLPPDDSFTFSCAAGGSILEDTAAVSPVLPRTPADANGANAATADGTADTEGDGRALAHSPSAPVVAWEPHPRGRASPARSYVLRAAAAAAAAPAATPGEVLAHLSGGQSPPDETTAATATGCASHGASSACSSSVSGRQRRHSLAATRPASTQPIPVTRSPSVGAGAGGDELSESARTGVVRCWTPSGAGRRSTRPFEWAEFSFWTTESVASPTHSEGPSPAAAAGPGGGPNASGGVWLAATNGLAPSPSLSLSGAPLLSSVNGSHSGSAPDTDAVPPTLSEATAASAAAAAFIPHQPPAPSPAATAPPAPLAHHRSGPVTAADLAAACVRVHSMGSMTPPSPALGQGGAVSSGADASDGACLLSPAMGTPTLSDRPHHAHRHHHTHRHPHRTHALDRGDRGGDANTDDAGTAHNSPCPRSHSHSQNHSNRDRTATLPSTSLAAAAPAPSGPPPKAGLPVEASAPPPAVQASSAASAFTTSPALLALAPLSIPPLPSVAQPPFPLAATASAPPALPAEYPLPVTAPAAAIPYSLPLACAAAAQATPLPHSSPTLSAAAPLLPSDGSSAPSPDLAALRATRHHHQHHHHRHHHRAGRRSAVDSPICPGLTTAPGSGCPAVWACVSSTAAPFSAGSTTVPPAQSAPAAGTTPPVAPAPPADGLVPTGPVVTATLASTAGSGALATLPPRPPPLASNSSPLATTPPSPPASSHGGGHHHRHRHASERRHCSINRSVHPAPATPGQAPAAAAATTLQCATPLPHACTSLFLALPSATGSGSLSATSSGGGGADDGWPGSGTGTPTGNEDAAAPASLAVTAVVHAAPAVPVGLSPHPTSATGAVPSHCAPAATCSLEPLPASFFASASPRDKLLEHLSAAADRPHPAADADTTKALAPAADAVTANETPSTAFTRCAAALLAPPVLLPTAQPPGGGGLLPPLLPPPLSPPPGAYRAGALFPGDLPAASSTATTATATTATATTATSPASSPAPSPPPLVAPPSQAIAAAATAETASPAAPATPGTSATGTGTTPTSCASHSGAHHLMHTRPPTLALATTSPPTSPTLPVDVLGAIPGLGVSASAPCSPASSQPSTPPSRTSASHIASGSGSRRLRPPPALMLPPPSPLDTPAALRTPSVINPAGSVLVPPGPCIGELLQVPSNSMFTTSPCASSASPTAATSPTSATSFAATTPSGSAPGDVAGTVGGSSLPALFAQQQPLHGVATGPASACASSTGSNSARGGGGPLAWPAPVPLSAAGSTSTATALTPTFGASPAAASLGRFAGGASSPSGLWTPSIVSRAGSVVVRTPPGTATTAAAAAAPALSAQLSNCLPLGGDSMTGGGAGGAGGAGGLGGNSTLLDISSPDCSALAAPHGTLPTIAGGDGVDGDGGCDETISSQLFEWHDDGTLKADCFSTSSPSTAHRHLSPTGTSPTTHVPLLSATTLAGDPAGKASQTTTFLAATPTGPSCSWGHHAAGATTSASGLDRWGDGRPPHVVETAGTGKTCDRSLYQLTVGGGGGGGGAGVGSSGSGGSGGWGGGGALGDLPSPTACSVVSAESGTLTIPPGPSPELPATAEAAV